MNTQLIFCLLQQAASCLHVLTAAAVLGRLILFCFGKGPPRVSQNSNMLQLTCLTLKYMKQSIGMQSRDI